MGYIPMFAILIPIHSIEKNCLSSHNRNNQTNCQCKRSLGMLCDILYLCTNTCSSLARGWVPTAYLPNIRIQLDKPIKNFIGTSNSCNSELCEGQLVTTLNFGWMLFAMYSTSAACPITMGTAGKRNKITQNQDEPTRMFSSRMRTTLFSGRHKMSVP